jgi:hypothetical protein
VELPHRALARLSLGAALLVVAALLGAAVAPSALAADPERPASDTTPPRFFQHSAREVERIAARAD